VTGDSVTGDSVTGDPTLTPRDLATALGLPPPTPEQAEVIGAPPEPCVVVAGAGSGKTETMAARVVWLVANGYVTPDRVLGLTFTRKAAGELGQRVRIRLAQLRDRRVAGGGAEVAPGEPTVLTYHAYAARLLAEHALRVPVEPSVRLLTEATTWQLAQRVVRAYDGDLSHVDWTPGTVVDAVLAIAADLAEHLREPAELRAWTDSFVEAASALPRAPGQRTREDVYAAVRDVLDAQLARVELLPLVERYVRRKRDADAMDFGDQMSLAARIADRFAAVGHAERVRFGVVLLDEYQDTGHAQRVLLRALYGGGHPVTAVGDPCQSIYGWRGASAGNLTRFAADFPRRDGAPARAFPLTTSFRNGARILGLANRLADPLRATGITVPRLRPFPANPAGRVLCGLHETAVDEAAWLAEAVDGAWRDAVARSAGGGPAPTAAVLVRRRSQIPRLEQALRDRGLPVEVVGLGGLLDTPEVRDIVATLRVLDDPGAGDALMRLLTGARWRIGPRDLEALSRRAAALAARTRRAAGAPEVGGGAAELSVPDAVDERSLIDALDSLGPPAAYSAAGYLRLRALAAELRTLRARSGQPLPDLVADVERTLGLDVEVAARPDRQVATARAHLDRFQDEASEFAGGAEAAGLGAFLAYLDAAALREDGLQPGTVDVQPDRVQVLTAHAAKGLEWDVVAVPGLTAQVFPAPGRGEDWTRDPRCLPYPLRGDAADLPGFDPATAADQKELDGLRKEYQQRCAELGALEERRLAYVAATRARRLLICSGYWWDDAARPRGPSAFLEETRQEAEPGEIERWADAPADDAANPLLAEPDRMVWPVDPLGARRADVEAGAALVRAALAAADGGHAEQAHPSPGAPPEGHRRRRSARAHLADAGQGALFDPAVPEAQTWSAEADLLLAERDRAAAATGRAVDVALPRQLSVTALVALRRDPAELARQIRRPTPSRPAPLSRRGTAFHAWLEERLGGERLLDLDELPGAADDGAAPEADLALLQHRFLASEWAQRRPAEVEVPFETVVGDVVVRGRIDAVFRDDDGGWTVVDWKTGAEPTGVAKRAAEVQLAAYRLAWADLSGAPLDLVRAAFHYVRSNYTARPADLLDADRLRALVEGVPVLAG
jgi:DNA helicase II / ATP-dependent DNA helicase PcrA